MARTAPPAAQPLRKVLLFMLILSLDLVQGPFYHRGDEQSSAKNGKNLPEPGTEALGMSAADVS